MFQNVNASSKTLTQHTSPLQALCQVANAVMVGDITRHGVYWLQLTLPGTMALWFHDMYLQLEFGPKAGNLLIRKHRLDSPYRLRIFTDKNVDDICNIMRKPGS